MRAGLPPEERATARGAEDAAWLALQSARLDASVDATAAAAGAAAASAAHYEVKRAELRLRAEAERRLAATEPDPALRAFLLQSLDLRADPPRWRLNLDVLEADMPKIVGWPEVTGQFAGPVLFLSGAESGYVRAEDRAAILGLFPAARFAKIPGAGHWLHAEKPREFEAAVRVFLG